MEVINASLEQRLGNYRLLRLLGKGGSADVYLGEHIYLKTLAAVKVLRTRLVNEDQEQFLNEARIIAHLKHPNIVRVLEYGVQGTNPFLVMSYAPNGSFTQRYPRGIRLSIAAVLPFIKQIASSLQYAHNCKVIHRDVKPANILLGQNNAVLLSDFGIALIARSSHSQDMQAVVGTVAYMAPEQLKGKPCFASDQYALGIMVYEWLCGKHPFSGTNYLDMARQHLLVVPPSLYESAPDILPSVEVVILKALAKDHHERFESIQAFADALENAFLSSSLLSVQPTHLLVDESSPLLLSSSPMKRPRHISRRAALGTLGTLTGVSIAGGIGAWKYFELSHQTYTKIRSAIRPSPLRVPQGTTLCTYRGQPYAVGILAWSPDGQRIASVGGDTGVRVWEAFTGSDIITHHASYFTGNDLAWSPDGQYLASVDAINTTQNGSTSTQNLLYVWNSTTGTDLFTLPAIGGVAWSPDGRYLAFPGNYGGGWVTIWDFVTKQDRITLSAPDPSLAGGTADVIVAWSPDSRRIASGIDLSAFVPITTPQMKQQFIISDITTGKIVCSHYSDPLSVSNHNHSSLAWSPDGRSIASTEGAAVAIWDTHTGQTRVRYQGHADIVFEVSWSPDGKYLASASADATVQIWDATTGKMMFSYRKHSGDVAVVRWSPKGNYIASGDSTTIQVWQAL